MIRNYMQNDEAALLDLWNTAGTAMGFAPLSQDAFRTLLTGHPNFSPEYTFVLEEQGKILGFTNGCTGDGIPKGDVRGYVSCLVRPQRPIRLKIPACCSRPWRMPSGRPGGSTAP